MFDRKDYKKSFDELTKNHAAVAMELTRLQQAYEAEQRLSHSLTSLLEDSREKVRILQQEIEALSDPDQYIDQLKRDRNRAYANGRADAYREMGVRALDAKKDGNSLVILEDGSIVELLSGLEDVQIECKFYGGACAYPQGECDDCPRHEAEREWANTPDEIVIDDLADKGGNEL